MAAGGGVPAHTTDWARRNVCLSIWTDWPSNGIPIRKEDGKGLCLVWGTGETVSNGLSLCNCIGEEFALASLLRQAEPVMIRRRGSVWGGSNKSARANRDQESSDADAKRHLARRSLLAALLFFGVDGV